eukprot:7446100-Alexandrium_andersonii.AAC.1
MQSKQHRGQCAGLEPEGYGHTRTHTRTHATHTRTHRIAPIGTSRGCCVALYIGSHQFDVAHTRQSCNVLASAAAHSPHMLLSFHFADWACLEKWVLH